MDTTVPMPAWLRAWQQSWVYQAVVLPTVIGFGGSLMLQGCLANGLENLQRACVVAALDGFFISLITSFLKGHSPGSPQFASNGTTIDAVPQLKELVDNTITVHAQAKDPNFPAVTPANAANATAAVDTAVQAVNEQNAIVKDALANEVKPEVKQ